MEERLQKILSQWGIASRRQAEQLILEGRVMVNGAIAELGQKANSQTDQIAVDGSAIKPASRPNSCYLLLHKPDGVVSTCYDPWNRPTVLDLLPEFWQQGQAIHPIGRLDVDSTGALLLTNDGQLTHYLTHPRHQIFKTYEVTVTGHPSDHRLQRWRQGIVLLGRKTLPAQVTVLKQLSHNRTLLRVVLKEGRNRQIRRVAEQLGHPVTALKRTAIGSVELGSLPSGEYRFLTPAEVAILSPPAPLTARLSSSHTPRSLLDS
ncbi:MAG: rRNA pseudouridine synthase [Leptolyngbyaceae cyanobacterium SM1_1_3]|nr:rRNA pseudouridine synthase [Leptolyngbyaceae cyanobacterium SM1_1_3]NJM85753.1 rRNA pseudouridine synthase [Leptolyngbyaceae cyanobacterium RM2_2_21]NJN04669.1 rRNA pseudouridine synthase [Leptolyngbyaceae cyanobacterium RM1_1_2]NJO09214.1 rRNA pseudouridine synthase [Leptolyngbyaceae cyanobacterium SL_1_1]